MCRRKVPMKALQKAQPMAPMKAALTAHSMVRPANGSALGAADGSEDGSGLDSADGSKLGSDEGWELCWLEGWELGLPGGSALGSADGSADGSDDGYALGSADGWADGSALLVPQRTRTMAQMEGSRAVGTASSFSVSRWDCLSVSSMVTGLVGF